METVADVNVCGSYPSNNLPTERPEAGPVLCDTQRPVCQPGQALEGREELLDRIHHLHPLVVSHCP